jgi:hypothetical protein
MSLSVVRQRLSRWMLCHELRHAGGLALNLSQLAATSRFEGPAGETAAEFDRLAHTLLDWAERFAEIREAARAR